MADDLNTELDELRALLGEDYRSLECEQQEINFGTAREQPLQDGEFGENEDNRQECTVAGDLDTGFSRDGTIHSEFSPRYESHTRQYRNRIGRALQASGVLQRALSGFLEKVDRQIQETDHAISMVNKARLIDRNVGKEAGVPQFSWTVRHSTTARGSDRLLGIDGKPAPMSSTFWERSGNYPKPNEDATKLRTLFWRNPAAAKAPKPWNWAESSILKTAVQRVTLAQQRMALTERFQSDLALGMDPRLLKEALAKDLEELSQPETVERNGYGIDACLRSACNFSRQEWYSVSQHMYDRTPDECMVHVSTHIHPDFAAEAGRPLSVAEKTRLLDAVSLYGERQWAAVAAECGLQWPAWRLMQAHQQAVNSEIRSVTGGQPAMQSWWPPHEFQWTEAMDQQLQGVCQTFMGPGLTFGRRCTWVHVAFLVGNGCTGEQCMERFWKIQRIQRKRGTFSQEETDALNAAVLKYGYAWGKVASLVPGRTARQCNEHHMNAVSRRASELKGVWTSEMHTKLIEARESFRKGLRLPDWPAVAECLSKHCGSHLTVEDCRKRSKVLVRKLSVHGMPNGLTLPEQANYLRAHPGVLDTKMDKTREELRKWAAEMGIEFRENLPPHLAGVPSDGGALRADLEHIHLCNDPNASQHLSITPSSGDTLPGCSSFPHGEFLTRSASDSHPLFSMHPGSSLRDQDSAYSTERRRCTSSQQHDHRTRAIDILESVDTASFPVAAAIKRYFLVRSTVSAVGYHDDGVVQTAQLPDTTTTEHTSLIAQASVPPTVAQTTVDCAPEFGIGALSLDVLHSSTLLPPIASLHGAATPPPPMASAPSLFVQAQDHMPGAGVERLDSTCRGVRARCGDPCILGPTQAAVPFAGHALLENTSRDEVDPSLARQTSYCSGPERTQFGNCSSTLPNARYLTPGTVGELYQDPFPGVRVSAVRRKQLLQRLRALGRLRVCVLMQGWKQQSERSWPASAASCRESVWRSSMSSRKRKKSEGVRGNGGLCVSSAKRGKPRP